MPKFLRSSKDSHERFIKVIKPFMPQPSPNNTCVKLVLYPKETRLFPWKLQDIHFIHFSEEVKFLKSRPKIPKYEY